jgi:hypothetical protein
MSTLGCLFEWYSINLLAIDALSDQMVKVVDDFLRENAGLGRLNYERGWTT